MDYIDYMALYQKLGVVFEQENNGEAIGKCPFHEDNKSSFALQIEHGLWKCFAGCGQGNITHFVSKKYGTTITDSEDVLKAVLKPITEDYITPHKNLIDNHKVLDVFCKRRGLTPDTIKKYKIGFDGDRFTVPVFIGNVLVNIRRYALDCGKGQAKMLNVPEYGSIKLFPYENLKAETIYLFEGEMDCLLANQNGINGVTVTSGAGTWREEWSSLFRDKKVFICYDIDKAGKKGAHTIAEHLKNFAREIRIINLPITEPANGDFTNYMVDYARSADDFLKLGETAEVPAPASVTEAAPITLPDTL
jgi:DNA primase